MKERFIIILYIFKIIKFIFSWKPLEIIRENGETLEAKMKNFVPFEPCWDYTKTFASSPF